MPTSYNSLRAAPLASLASTALDASLPATACLACWESLQARVHEVPDGWAGFDPTERATIRRAMALDLAPLGFAA